MNLPNFVVAESTITFRRGKELSFLSCTLHLHRLHRPVLVVEAMHRDGPRWVRTGAGALLAFERIANTEIDDFRDLDDVHGMKRCDVRKAA